MANRWQYPRWRRVTMQVAMWGVFVASLGTAAMLSNRPMQRAHLQEGYAGPLREPLLPYGWVQVDREPGEDPAVVLRAEEPSADGRGRSLTLLVLPAGNDTAPLEFLARHSLPLQLEQVSVDGHFDDTRAPMHIRMFGQPALLTGGTVVERNRGRTYRGQVYHAVAVVPGQFAVLVTLQGLGPPQPDDVDVLRRVAESIELKDVANVRRPDAPLPLAEASTPSNEVAARPVDVANPSNGTLTLANGTQVVVPAGYQPSPTIEPNRTGQTLTRQPNGVLELIPCLVTDADTADDRVALVELHDPAYSGGTVRPLPDSIQGMRQFQIVPGGPTRAATAAPIAAYLVVDAATGNALLALFRGPIVGGTAYDAAWQSLVSGVRFGPAQNLPKLTSAGERAAQQARGVKATITVAERWWLWVRDGSNPLVGWTAQQPAEVGNPLAAVRRTVRRDAGTLHQSEDRWERDASLSAYSRQTIVGNGDAGPGANGSTVSAAKHFVRLAGGQLLSGTSGPGGTQSRPPRKMPRNFVPGVLLESVLGAIDVAEPILLRTDGFPGCEPSVQAGLLTLKVEPIAADPAAEGLATLQSLAITVNGSGEVSRWYFNDDGTVAQIDFPAGLHRKPSTETEIENSFSNDPQMQP